MRVRDKGLVMLVIVNGWWGRIKKIKKNTFKVLKYY